MKKEPNLDKQEQAHQSKLRGISDLSFDAIHGITDIVESLHATIQSKFIISKKDNSKETTKGLTGFVYKNIRYMTNLVGTGIDKVLENIERLVLSDYQNNSISYSREAMLSALNGAIGDHLAAKNNPLAIKMQFRYHGQVLTENQVVERIKESDDKLMLMIHGLCMNDLQWTKLDHNHGEELAKELDCAAIYLYYNTGMHISENGQVLAGLLEQIHTKLGRSFKINVLAHSMGGLLVRSATELANQQQMNWLSCLSKVVFLGTPHHGAKLEKLGNWLDSILSLSPFTKPFSKIGKIRSSGITDLRYGNLLETDWNQEDRFEVSGDQRTAVPLLDSSDYYAVAATSSSNNDLNNHSLIGDGLVSVASALGEHSLSKYQLNFDESNICITQKCNHMQLLSDIRVYQQIKQWLID